MEKAVNRVGFVGLGTMGAAMVSRLIDQGVSLVIHDIQQDSAAPHLARGAEWAPDLEAIALACDTVLLSLPGPPQIEQVVAGPNGLLSHLKTGSVVVDLSTNSVSSVRELAHKASDRGVAFIDSPVSGGSTGAREGNLVLMIGGDAKGIDKVELLLANLARKVFRLGESGAGTIAKLINNQLYLCGEVLFFEGLVLAAKAGLAPDALCEILELTGVGGAHARLAPRILERRYDDRTFTLGLAEKDVALALEASASLDAPMPATEAAHRLFVEALAEGLREKNFWSAIEVAEKRARVRIDNPAES